jgi:hypothetical protein
MAGFAMRAMDLPRYRDVRARLDLLGAGDRLARQELASAMAGAMCDDALLERNSLMQGSLQRWRDSIAGLVNGGASVNMETVAEAAIALLAMPRFQFTHAGTGMAPSPSLVVLGEDDGGLYGILVAADARVTDIFGARPDRPPEPYPVMGEGMIVLPRDDVSTLLEVAARVGAHGVAETARERLEALLEWCLQDEARAIAVSFES